MIRTSVIMLALCVSNLFGQTEIEMKYEKGVYTIPCEVNGLKMKFILDTGASDVMIGLNEAIFMLKNGYLSEANIKGSNSFQTAAGSIKSGTKILLDEILIGEYTLYGVQATVVHDLFAPLLLGQSALRKFKSITFDYEKQVLLINPDYYYAKALAFTSENETNLKAGKYLFKVQVENILFIDTDLVLGVPSFAMAYAGVIVYVLENYDKDNYLVQYESVRGLVEKEKIDDLPKLD